MSEVLFGSVKADHKVTIRPARKQMVGQEVVVVPGKVAAFRSHRLKTSDPEEIEFLRGHNRYGIDYFEMDEPRTMPSRVQMVRGARTPMADSAPEAEALTAPPPEPEISPKKAGRPKKSKEESE